MLIPLVLTFKIVDSHDVPDVFQQYLDPGFRYSLFQRPELVRSREDALRDGLNCVSLAHLVIRDLFGYTLPASLQSYELARDREHFEPVADPADLRAGDLVWFGLEGPEASLETFVPRFDGDNLVNWRDMPVKHVAVATGTRDGGGDPLLLHASKIAGTNVVWPLRRFRDYDRYQRIHVILRLRPAFRGPAVPDFATHYYRASRAPFLNLSDLPEEQALTVMADLTRERREGLQHRPFGRIYLDMRREAEDRLRRHFTRLGGRPERRVPHYFVLGESPWFSGLASDMREIRVPLAALPAEQTTVTWSDSFAAMEVTRDFGLTFTPRPYYGRLYRLADIPALAARHGLPEAGSQSYQGLVTADVPDTFVEIQLWSDAPVRRYFSRS